MRVKLSAKEFRPTVLELHRLQPGHGYLCFDDSQSSGNKQFVAHVKQDDGIIGSLIIPMDVMTNGITSEYSSLQGGKIVCKHWNFFGSFFYYSSSTYESFINQRLPAAEKWLESDKANSNFKEMFHCPANYPQDYGLPLEPPTWKK